MDSGITNNVEKAKRRIEKSGHANSRVKLLWKTDLNKEVITQNFIDRLWEEVSNESDNWNFYWASVNTINKIFSGKNLIKLTDNQILCHFPNFYELTRKDLMAKNIKKYKKQLLKDNRSIDNLNFIPLTYVLPQDMPIFIEEFKRYPNSIWILKPSNKCQGQGIRLVNKTSKLKKMNFNTKTINENNTSITITETYVISKYIENPFLIGGKKFDMRIYCLVTSFHPLKAYLYKQGFCRFCNEKFSVDVSDINNIYMHLTNVAVQKRYEKYSKSHGGKFSLYNLNLYLENLYGYEKAKKCNEDIKNVIIGSLQCVQKVMFSDKHCFELYGYDILLDDNLKPWLIEINSSPSLSTSTKTDYILKKNLLSDVMDIIVTDRWIDEKGKCGVNTYDKDTCGNFEVLIDEIGKNGNGEKNEKNYVKDEKKKSEKSDKGLKYVNMKKRSSMNF